jgi:hypothetical protein
MKRLLGHLHPLFFAVFPILFLYSHNINQVPAAEVVRPLSVMLGVGLLSAAITWLLPGRGLTAMALSLGYLYFFSYGHFFAKIQELCGGILTTHEQSTVLYLWTILLALMCYIVVRVRRHLESINLFMGVVSLSLVTMSALACGQFHLQKKNIAQPSGRDETFASISRPDTLRDIYYIICDRYPSKAILKEVYGYDNRPFLDFLRSRGFYVAEKSHANYLKTALSLGSSLNLEPINDLEQKIGKDSDNWLPLYAMLQDYRLWHVLKAQGYQFLHFGAWWEPTRKNRFADANYNIMPMPEFMMLMYQTTILYPINAENPKVKNRLNATNRELHYQRIRYEFEQLAQIPRRKEPTFTFAHMLVPHDPYVFDSTGEFLSEDVLYQRKEETNFLNQVIFVNSRIRSVIDSLLQNSPVKPIIVLQADEGPQGNILGDPPEDEHPQCLLLSGFRLRPAVSDHHAGELVSADLQPLFRCQPAAAARSLLYLQRRQTPLHVLRCDGSAQARIR